MNWRTDSCSSGVSDFTRSPSDSSAIAPSVWPRGFIRYISLVPTILDGNRVRDQIKAECRPRVERMVTQAGRAPGLAVVLVGNNPASEVYVGNKPKTPPKSGIWAKPITPPAESTQGH